MTNDRRADWLTRRVRDGAAWWQMWAVAAGALLATAVDDGQDGNTYATVVDLIFGAAATARCVLLWRRGRRAAP